MTEYIRPSNELLRSLSAHTLRFLEMAELYGIDVALDWSMVERPKIIERFTND